MNLNKTIIKNIRFLMEKNNVLQKQLAVDLNIPVNTLNNYLNDKSEFRNEILLKIAKHFNVSIDYLFSYSSPEKKYNQEYIYEQLNNLEKIINETRESIQNETDNDE